MDRFRVGTFNLLNFNLPGLPLYRDTDGWSAAEFGLKADWTARNIKVLSPDIMGFQELWHGDALAQALARASLGAGYDMLVPPNADGKRIVCAAIVRKGLIEGAPEWIEAFPPKFLLESKGENAQTPAISVAIKSFSRPVLHFAVKPRANAETIHVYVCHFKSKGPTRVDDEDWYKADKTFYAPHAGALRSPPSGARRRPQRCGSS